MTIGDTVRIMAGYVWRGKVGRVVSTHGVITTAGRAAYTLTVEVPPDDRYAYPRRVTVQAAHVERVTEAT